MSGPLSGVKVLDLTAMLAGPYATMLLSDLGADVVKVEAPTGDRTRTIGPFRGETGNKGLGGYFQSINRGKRSIVLDLTNSSDRDTFIHLAGNADVLVENFSVGVMDRLGVGFETLHKLNQRLVYAAIRGFGDPRTGESPYVTWPAFDIVAQAMGGFLSITGNDDGSPVKSGPGIGDIFPATLLSLGIVAALRHAERTGQGQFLDVAMTDAMLSLTERIIYQYSITGAVPHAEGNKHPLLCPFDVFQTKDGWVAVAAPSDRHWAIVAETIERPDMIVDPRYSTNSGRVQHGTAIRDALTRWLERHTTAEVVAAMGGKVPIGPVRNAAEIFSDPHVVARRMLVEIDDPGTEGTITVAGQPIKFTETPAEPERRGPILGESDPKDVLAEWEQ